MRLDEIDVSTAADQRIKRLKADAKAATAKAKQLRAQADASASQLAIQKARKQQSLATRASVDSVITPHS